MILKAQNLSKNFGDVEAVRGVSFEIAAGEIYSLLGPNGAGKTTTISMLTGLLTPTSGDAFLDGFSIRENAHQVKKIIGVVPQEIALYPTISARENLLFWGKMQGLRGKRLAQRVDAALDIAGLQDRAKYRVDTFSGGMKRRLNIAVGLLHEPKIIFMDEPTVGIDPQSRRRILDTVKALNAEGMTVLYTTHYMEEAEELSDRIGIIDDGKLIAEGTLDALTRQVGELDTLRITAEPAEKLADYAAELQRLPEVERAFGEEGVLIVQARNANQTLAEVVRYFNQVGGKILSLQIQEPNLETLFLRLTGRALRD
jgi:ABC-2 type transport system ATP-binding protein